VGRGDSGRPDVALPGDLAVWRAALGIPITTSDRPVITGSGKRADGHRALSLAVGILDGIVASIPVAWDVRISRSLTAAGPVAIGLARRGPRRRSPRRDWSERSSSVAVSAAASIRRSRSRSVPSDRGITTATTADLVRDRAVLVDRTGSGVLHELNSAATAAGSPRSGLAAAGASLGRRHGGRVAGDRAAGQRSSGFRPTPWLRERRALPGPGARVAGYVVLCGFRKRSACSRSSVVRGRRRPRRRARGLSARAGEGGPARRRRSPGNSRSVARSARARRVNAQDAGDDHRQRFAWNREARVRPRRGAHRRRHHRTASARSSGMSGDLTPVTTCRDSAPRTPGRSQSCSVSQVTGTSLRSAGCRGRGGSVSSVPTCPTATIGDTEARSRTAPIVAILRENAAHFGPWPEPGRRRRSPRRRRNALRHRHRRPLHWADGGHRCSS
jgi:hypothetical protein